MAGVRRVAAERGEFGHVRVAAPTAGLRGAVLPPRRVAWGDGALEGIRWGALSEPGGPVLLHGGAVNAHAWDAAMVRLGGPAWAVDLPGHGRSAWTPDGDFSPARLADALEPHVLPERRTLLAGHSLGGLVALELAARRPDRVSGVLLLDVTPDPSPVAAGGIREFVGRGASFASRREIVARARAYGLGSDGTTLDVGVRLNTRRRSDGRFEFRHQLAHLADDAPGIGWHVEETWSLLEGLDVPVALVRGETGLVSAASERRFAASGRLRRSTTVDGGHNVPSRHPGVVARELARMLRATPATAA